MPKPFSSRPLPALRRALPLLLAAALAGCATPPPWSSQTVLPLKK